LSPAFARTRTTDLLRDGLDHNARL
jgi:hypothetical protein